MPDIREMMDYLDEKDFMYLNLLYTDIFGGLHNLTVPVWEFNTGEITHGIPFDASSIPGFDKLNKGDMALLPQPNTVFQDNIAGGDGVASVFCNIVDAENGTEISADPRTILMKAEKLLRKELGAQSLWLPEIEFYLFRSVSINYDDYRAAFSFDVDEIFDRKEIITIRSEDYNFLDNTPFSKNIRISKNISGKQYHRQIPFDEGYDFRNELIYNLQTAGFKVRYHHHEVGRFQHEIELLPLPPARAADGVIAVKYLARMLAGERDFAAVFLPKPIHNLPGNGLHFHQLFLKRGRSLFWDENSKYAHLSDIALNYIAGLLFHAPALTALTNPSTNSFHRLVSGFEAPTKLFFGLANRSAAIRIPKYVDSPQKKRIEYRPPDATANPYLAIAGMMLAGLDGIRKKMNPAKMNFGPFDDDVEKWDADRQEKLKSLPQSVSEAAKSLLDDSDFLTGDGIFSEQFLKIYSDALISEEKELRSRITTFEVAKYIDR
ncbi:glutamine synthetase beta-grasp domain-containing protein [bacterium]|nr:glutamine synthetase beta-grasp domain-containing protein [bacterium]